MPADVPQPRPTRPSGKISDRSTVLCGKPVTTNIDRSAVASVGSFESALSVLSAAVRPTARHARRDANGLARQFPFAVTKRASAPRVPLGTTSKSCRIVAIGSSVPRLQK